MVNFGKKVIFCRNALKLRASQFSPENVYIDCAQIENPPLFLSRITFMNKIFSREELRRRVFFNKHRIYNRSNFLTDDIKRKCSNITSKLLNTMIEDIDIQSNLNFHNFNFLLLDRYIFANQLYEIILAYFNYKVIFEHFKPSSVRIIHQMPKWEFNIIQKLSEQYKISQEYEKIPLNNHPLVFTLINFFLSTVSVRNNLWNFRNNYLVRKSGNFKKDHNKKSVLVYATTQVQANAVIPVISALKKMANNLRIFCLSYDSTQQNITNLYNKNGFLYIRRGVFQFHFKTPKIAVNPNVFLEEIRDKKLFSGIFNQFSEITPISAILSNWLLAFLEVRIPDILKRIRMVWQDVKNIRPSLLVIANEYLLTQKILTFIAKKQRFSSILVPHAQISSHYVLSRLDVDFMAAQGTHAVDYMRSLGTTPEKLIVTGMAKYDPLYKKYYQNPSLDKIKEDTCKVLGINRSKKVVLIISCGDEGAPREIKVRFIESILLLLKTRKDLEVVIKLHPRENPSTVKSLLAIHNLNYPIVQNFPLYDLILISDVLFTHQTGTTFEAMLFEKPSIEVNYESKDDIFEYAKYNSVYLVEHPNQLETALNLMLYDENERQRIIQGQKRYLEYDLYKFDGKSSERIAELLVSLIRTMEDKRESKFSLKYSVS